MEGLIALYIVYFLWKSTVEAVVNIVALARGKPAVGDGRKGRGKDGDRAGAEGEAYGRYFTRGLGTVIGGLAWALTEGVKTAWVAAGAKYGERLRDARARRRARLRRFVDPVSADGDGDLDDDRCARCGAVVAGFVGRRGRRRYVTWVPNTDVPGEGPVCDHHLDSEADDVDDAEYASWRCARCGRDLEDYASRGLSIRSVPGEGDICGVHLDSRCAACGHPPRGDDDPLVLVDGAWIHRSHTRDPRSGRYEPPGDDNGTAAAVTDDGTGEPVPAVWELESARSWASVHPDRT